MDRKGRKRSYSRDRQYGRYSGPGHRSMPRGRSRRRKGSRAGELLSRLLCFLLLIIIMAAVVLAVRAVLSHISSDEALHTGADTVMEEAASTAEAPSAPEPASEGAAESELSQTAFSVQETSALESPEASQAPSEPAKLLFAGDLYLSSHVLSAYDSAGGTSGILSPDLLQVIDESDIFMVNLEFPFSTRGTPEEDKSFTFQVSPDRVHILDELGVDIVTLANNHTLDYGTDALFDTLDTLDQAGIAHTGAGGDIAEACKAVLMEAKGRTYAFLGATRVIPYADWAATRLGPGLNSIYDAHKDRVLEELRELQDVSDYQIVYIHWGIERSEAPEPYMRSLAMELADAGADLIIGAHPHVLQGMEYIGDVPVIYSLGNFLFGSSIPRTMLLSVSWPMEGGRPELHFYPAKGALGYTQGITDEAGYADFMSWYESLPLDSASHPEESSG